MNKFYIFITFLVSFSISDKNRYLPMDKDSKYGEDVCRYYDNDGHFYVKPCEKGKYCASDFNSQITDYSYLEICQDLPKYAHYLNLDDKCTSTFECGYGLKCIGTSCTGDCGPDEFIRHTSSNSYTCENKVNKGSGGYCSQITFDNTGIQITKYSPAEKDKRCGKLTITEYTQTGLRGFYYISSDDYTNLGSVEDGQYVSDMKLCESGYALRFYYDGEFEDPKPSGASGSNTRYYKCVTPISISDLDINSGTCTINYKIGDKEYIYSLARSGDSNVLNQYNDFCLEKYINIKSDRYREFYKNINADRNTCEDMDGINKYTCENRELIKTWYFYKNPENYIIYNGREKLEKVLDYLIQTSYPTYYSFGRFLNF